MRWSIILPAIYCTIAALAWIDFARLPPDGLANVGLMLVVLPVTVLDLTLRGLLGLARSPLMPSHLQPRRAHSRGLALRDTSAFVVVGPLHRADALTCRPEAPSHASRALQ